MEALRKNLLPFSKNSGEISCQPFLQFYGIIQAIELF